MKEFEKFLTEELDKDNGSLTLGDKHYRWRNRDSWARDAWKAALEWVLKNLEEQYEYTAQGDTGWQGKFIEKELLGEQSDDQ